MADLTFRLAFFMIHTVVRLMRINNSEYSNLIVIDGFNFNPQCRMFFSVSNKV
jgi:hypothetical protein